MTSSQLARRAKILDAVIELIAEAGVDAVQMRDVAQRSGVALATLYKYFASKDDLVTAAVDGWQMQARPPSFTADEPPDQDPVNHILGYLRRIQHGVHANPEMTALTLQFAMSTEPREKGAIDNTLRTNGEIIRRVAGLVAPDDLRHVAFGISGALTSSLVGLLTGRMTLEESQNHVEWVARVLLGTPPPRPQTSADGASSGE